ncbi:MAG: DUF2459 domain-containing protein [Rhodovibrionaceae bacterium]
MRVSLFLAAWLLCLCGCAVSQSAQTADGEEAARHRIWVAVSGWHAEIVLSRSEVAASRLLPEAADFPQAVTLQFGWGDRRYYTAEDKSLGLALEAALRPSPSVLHVAGFVEPPERRYPPDKLLSLMLTEAEFRRLLRAISGDFLRDGTAPAESFSEGLFANSRFYEARGSFHLFNTCNTWTARKLEVAGLGLTSTGVVTTGDLAARLGASLPYPRAFSP